MTQERNLEHNFTEQRAKCECQPSTVTLWRQSWRQTLSVEIYWKMEMST